MTGCECLTAAALRTVIQASGSVPFRTSPISIQFTSENNRAFSGTQKSPTSQRHVKREDDVVLFVSGREKNSFSDRLLSVWLIISFFLLIPTNPYGQLVRSLAFPSLQPSLVHSFSPFPIISRTNRKQRTDSGPPVGTDRTFINGETQSEYLADLLE